MEELEMTYNDPEQEREYQKRWYEANKESVKARSRQWYIANKTRHRQNAKRWAEANKEKAAEYTRRYRLENADKAREDSRRARLKRLYDMTPEEYETMLRSQNDACAICRKPPNGKPLAVDHNHSTGVVRALLCDRCNHALGHLDEDPERARALATYLEAHK